MALAQIHSGACVGVEAPQVTVEVHLLGGLPRAQMLGAISPKTRISLATEKLHLRQLLIVPAFGHELSCFQSASSSASIVRTTT
jgi:magnesium chelatase family protein